MGAGVFEKRFVSGLLGQYSVWTKKCLDLFNDIKSVLKNKTLDYTEMLKIAGQVTDMNLALFDAVNNFKGSIAGIH